MVCDFQGREVGCVRFAQIPARQIWLQADT